MSDGLGGVKKIQQIMRFAIGWDVLLEPRQAKFRIWELIKLFPEEDAARIYMEQALWPSGPVCPRCKSGDNIGSGTAPYRCNACDREFTVRIGTIFERSHIPLHKWLCALLLLATARKRVSSYKLAGLLEIRQSSAWHMMKRIRPVWGERGEVFKGLFAHDYVNLFEDPDVPDQWPFFSSKTRCDKKFVKGRWDLRQLGDYPLAPDEILGCPASPRLRRTKAHFLSKWQIQALARRRENTYAHCEGHLRLIPFKWMPQRDCFICRFGSKEWRCWEGIAVFFDLQLWYLFLDWIEEGEVILTQIKVLDEQWDADNSDGLVLWDSNMEKRLRLVNPNVRERYERLVTWIEDRKRAEYEKMAIAKREKRLAEKELIDVEI
jgi:transposase-like protein